MSRLNKNERIAWISISISALAFLVSAVNVYFSQFHERSGLVAFVTALKVNSKDEKRSETSVEAKQIVSINVALSNSGNASASLLRVFWVVPNTLNYDCNRARKAVDWPDVLAFEGYYEPDFQVVAFTMQPTVVPPSGIALATGVIPERIVTRRAHEFGDKTICLVFASMGYTGEISIVSVSAASLQVNMQTTGYRMLLRHPIDLLPLIVALSPR